MARLDSSHNPRPAVLVIGHFPSSGGGFAADAWKKINEIFTTRNRLAFSERKLRDNRHGFKPKPLFETESLSGAEPLLWPTKLDDEGDAGSYGFKRKLYAKFKDNNVWGVISCCTAENSSKLIEALEPMDTPILTALDNTVRLAALSKPNVLQLIPNNALQAQAILSKVGDALQEGDEKVTVNVYLSPPHNDFVRDLWEALQNKANEAQNSRINLIGKTLREVETTPTRQDVVVYLGYYDQLVKLLKSVKAKKLILSDACYERRVEALMREKKRTYYLAKPSFDPSDYAYYGYISLSKVWLESLRGASGYTLDQRLLSIIVRLRSDMEKRFGMYRFVGTTNQSGGYVLRKTEHTEEE